MTRVLGAVAAVMVLSACSGGEVLRDSDLGGGRGGGDSAAPGASDGVVPGSPGGPQEEAVNPPIDAKTQLIELRVRGSEGSGYSSLLLVPNRIEVVADGQALLVSPTWATVNLADAAHAEKIATFALPLGANNVTFRVEMGAAGGFTGASSSGWIDTRSTTLEYESSGAELLRRGRSVVVVDTSRSFSVRNSTQLNFVPKYRVY